MSIRSLQTKTLRCIYKCAKTPIVKPETDNKKVIDSVRFYPALKADLTLICKEAGVTKQRVIEDALNYYFGDRSVALMRRQETIAATVEYHRKTRLHSGS